MSASGADESLDRRRFELLLRVLEIPPSDREALLAAEDPELANDVRARLAKADGQGEDFLARHEPPSLDTFPETIGPYRLVEPLGEGGMGRVFLAEQTEPVRRRVAVKLLRHVATGREARARFAAERHAMGRLDHPNVGKILEAGTTDDGQPYFAMEWIDGEAITSYCDRESLGLEQRLRLFVEVCRGVEHAHRKLLLHRDIKPSNVLVVDVDGRPTPKLIDFGIAKALDSSLVDAALATGDRLLGTPAYMSPEALGLGGELDIRSDVFSLGILLYELMTGDLPWSSDETPVMTLVRRQSGEPAERPSLRVVRLTAERRSEVAARRGEVAAHLARRLKGDLDWIILKAVAQDPVERYATVSELAADIERFLADEPVTAHAPDWIYLFRKLIRRQRGRVIAAALLLASLILGTVGTAIGFVRANREAERAGREAAAAMAARDDALVSSRSSELLATFFVDLFTADSSSATAAELLDRDVETLASRLSDSPATRAALMQKLAAIYSEWGDYDRAGELLGEAMAVLDPVSGAPRAEALEGYETWISVQWKQARYSEAGRVIEKALDTADRLPTPADPARLCRILSQGAIVMLELGRWRQADAWLERSERLLATIDESNPGRGSAMAMTEIARAGLHFDRREFRRSVERYQRVATALESTQGPNHRRLVVLWTFIGRGWLRLGRIDEAETILLRSLELGESYWFEDGYKLAQTRASLAAVYRELGRFEESESLLRQSLQARRVRLVSSHPAVAGDLNELARTLWQAGRRSEVPVLLDEARKILEANGEGIFPQTRDVWMQSARVELALGRPERAGELFRHVCDYLEGLEGAHPFDLGQCRLGVGRSLLAMGRHSDARESLEEAKSLFRQAGDDAMVSEVSAWLHGLP